VLAFVAAGDRIVAVEFLYSDAFRFFEKVLKKFGVTVTYVDGADTEALIGALPGAKLVYLESPTSWGFTLQDLPRVAAAARAAGVISVIDNSWATPLYQQPIRHGIDLVIHAASKYLGGHSDTVAGLVVGRQALIDRINHESYHYLGGKLAPFEAWLVLRGLHTLPLRLQRHMESGLAVARGLAINPGVARLRHPAFTDHAGQACLSGSGGLFAFDVREDVDVPAFVNALRLIRIGVSWGGPESLILPAMAALEISPETNVFRRFGMGDRTIRLAVGLEDPQLLLADLAQALLQARR